MRHVELPVSPCSCNKETRLSTLVPCVPVLVQGLKEFSNLAICLLFRMLSIQDTHCTCIVCVHDDDFASLQQLLMTLLLSCCLSSDNNVGCCCCCCVLCVFGVWFSQSICPACCCDVLSFFVVFAEFFCWMVWKLLCMRHTAHLGLFQKLHSCFGVLCFQKHKQKQTAWWHAVASLARRLN